MPEEGPTRPSLDAADPIVAATSEAACRWHLTPDGRLQPDTEPGIVETRVSPAQLDRALRLLQALIQASKARGLEPRPLERARGQRAGVGIGRYGNLVAVRLTEIRKLVAFADLDLDQWRRETPAWLIREDELRERGWVPRASGQLRILLPRRYGRPPRGERGWRFSFTDQVGRPLEDQLADVVRALEDRTVPIAGAR